MFLYSRWLQLPLPTRAAIASSFGIIKKGSTEVFENRVVSDGYVITEVEEALNIDAIQKYLGADDTDMVVLWDKMVCKVEGREYEPPRILVVPKEFFDEIKDNPPASGFDEKKPFCDSCDSKGVRHKKVCPKNLQKA